MSRSPFPSAADEQRTDHQRDLRKNGDWPDGRRTTAQIHAVAALTLSCEAVVESGVLGEKIEGVMRERIAAVLVAFGMRSKAELDAAFPGNGVYGG